MNRMRNAGALLRRERQEDRYPTEAGYNGTGDVNAAASFTFP